MECTLGWKFPRSGGTWTDRAVRARCMTYGGTAGGWAGRGHAWGILFFYHGCAQRCRALACVNTCAL